jgi:HK97 gp10 family phage protein
MTVTVIIDVIDDSVNPEVASQWLEDAAKIIIGTGKSEAPVATGELRGSIDLESISNYTATVVAAAEHAVYQEEGTSRGIEAQLFMEHGMNDAEDKYTGKLVFTKQLG